MGRLPEYKRAKSGKQSRIDFCHLAQNFDRQDDLTHACILTGCDYLKGLPGFGLKTSAKVLKEFRSLDRCINFILKKAKQKSRKKGKNEKFSDYRKDFERSFLTFLHQRVYDRGTKTLVHLTPLGSRFNAFKTEFEKKGAEFSDNFLGPSLSSLMAEKIAKCEVNPRSMKAFELNEKLECSSELKNLIADCLTPVSIRPRQPIIDAKSYENVERKLNGNVDDLFGIYSQPVKKEKPSLIQELPTVTDFECIALDCKIEDGFTSDEGEDFIFDDIELSDDEDFLNLVKQECEEPIERDITLCTKRKAGSPLPEPKRRKSPLIKKTSSFKNLPTRCLNSNTNLFSEFQESSLDLESSKHRLFSSKLSFGSEKIKRKNSFTKTNITKKKNPFSKPKKSRPKPSPQQTLHSFFNSKT